SRPARPIPTRPRPRGASTSSRSSRRERSCGPRSTRSSSAARTTRSCARASRRSPARACGSSIRRPRPPSPSVRSSRRIGSSAARRARSTRCTPPAHGSASPRSRAGSSARTYRSTRRRSSPLGLTSAITGLPYVGKTTLFNLLTGAHAATGGFAGAEAETNVGVAKVPDERVDRLAPLFQPKKTTHAEITYRDLGLAKPAAPGQAISAQKLGDLRTADALVHVVRAFADAAVPHVEGTVDPARDLATLELELLFA